MKWFHISGAVGLILLIIGHGMGLFVAPPEAMMGDVGRILYAHVPTAWVALVAYLCAFIAAIGALWSGRRTWDASVVGFVEVGVLLTALLLFQGSTWARPTWGVWWTWDPRLTTSAILLVAFSAVLLLRSVIDQPERRMLVCSVATIVAFVDVPIVYMSIKWWNTLHQNFSSPETVNNYMVTPLRISAFGMLFIMLAFVGKRRRIELARLDKEWSLTPPPERPTALNLNEEGAQ
jgi:heme exporter protein C